MDVIRSSCDQLLFFSNISFSKRGPNEQPTETPQLTQANRRLQLTATAVALIVIDLKKILVILTDHLRLEFVRLGG